MSDPVWYRSLYWRIALGFVALLASLLVIQAGVFIWLTVVVGRSTLGPAQLASEVAADLGAEMTRSPDLNLDAHLRRQFGRIYQPFLVVMHDGRTASNRPDGLPPNFLRSIQAARARRPIDRTIDGERPEPRTEGASRDPGRAGPRRPELAPILVDGRELGLVGVPGNPPPVGVVMQQFGPTLAWVAVALLLGGAAVTAVLIFGPARRRLRSLERAAAALGQGRPHARAIESGGDEVSALARTFNRMADDLSARTGALLASDRARRQLLADVSHELMTPLAAIRGYTETLAMADLPLDAATRQRYLGIIGEETQKLETMIGDLLDLARLEGGGGELDLEKVPVAALFRRVTDRHGPTIRERSIDVHVSVEPPDLTIQVDADRFEQALQNLAANALRHTPAGGGVEMRARRADGAVILAVRDTGPGIPSEHLERVFDRFYKVDASRSGSGPASGSGLGLSIVRAIVERHGGRVVARNAAGGGAEFAINLPGGESDPKR